MWSWAATSCGIDTGSVYVTDNFFALLGEPRSVDGSSLTVRTL